LHHGVLFLDELSEFRRDALEGLRQPLEDGRVVVARASGAVDFPARFALVAASNPCPCGFEGDPQRMCRCLPHRVLAHRQRLSGPLLDRIDIHLSVPRLSRAELLGTQPGEASGAIRWRVEEARARQRSSLSGTPWTCNAQMPGAMARRRAGLTEDAEAILSLAVESMVLSGRGFDRALKVARTIADLAGEERIGPDHIREALSYRAGPSAQEMTEAG